MKAHTHSKSALGIMISMCFLLLAGTCDHTELKGEIAAEKGNLRVGERISLELIVPPRLDAIYRVSWYVEPNDMGTVEFKAYDPMEYTKEEGGLPVFGKDDRRASFTAKKPGRCVISADGFYKQTNPQPIAKTTINIVE